MENFRGFFTRFFLEANILLITKKLSLLGKKNGKRRLPSMAYSFGIGTAIKIPEFSLSCSDVAINLAACCAELTLYGALDPLRRV